MYHIVRMKTTVVLYRSIIMPLSNMSMVLMSFLGQVVIEGERRDGCSGQYDQIRNARLPRALDPHSVPSEEFSTSLG